MKPGRTASEQINSRIKVEKLRFENCTKKCISFHYRRLCLIAPEESGGFSANSSSRLVKMGVPMREKPRKSHHRLVRVIVTV